MALRTLYSASTRSLNVSGVPAGSFSNILTITAWAAATLRFKTRPRSVVSNSFLSGNAERTRCRRPSASNGRAIVSVAPNAQACIDPMVNGIGENEQPRHVLVGFGTNFITPLLPALGGAQIDIDHDPRKMIGRRVGNIRGRDSIHLARRLQNAGQFAAPVAAIRGQQQPALGRRR